MECTKQLMFPFLAVRACFELTEQALKFCNLKNCPTAAVVVSGIKAIAHILPQSLLQTFCSVGLSNVEDIAVGGILVFCPFFLKRCNRIRIAGMIFDFA